MVFCSKLFWSTVRKNCSSDWEKLLKFEAEHWEFAYNLRSVEQLILTVKGQYNFWNRMFLKSNTLDLLELELELDI